jgi:hypothetical protein
MSEVYKTSVNMLLTLGRFPRLNAGAARLKGEEEMENGSIELIQYLQGG